MGKRWPDVVKTYREVNKLLGDIVKVTPSSKSVGDLAIFLHNAVPHMSPLVPYSQTDHTHTIHTHFINRPGTRATPLLA